MSNSSSASNSEAHRCYLSIDGDVFDDFTDYAVSSALLHAADGFHFATPWIGGRGGERALGELEDRGLVEGAIVRLHVRTPHGLALQLTGPIEEIDYDTQRGRGSMIAIVGRDHMAALVEGDTFPSLAMTGATLRDVIVKAVAPYGFSAKDLVVDNDANRLLITGKPAAGVALSKDAPIKLEDLKADQAHPHAGETVFAFLDRHAKRFGLMIWGSADGRIIVGRPNYEQAPLYSIICQTGAAAEANNAEDAKRRKSVQRRPSEVHVYGRTGVRDFSQSNVHAVEYDEYVKSCGIYRPLVVHDSSVKTNSEATQRARYELGLRRQTGDVCSFRLSGHATADGAVYGIDTIADVRWDAGGVREPRYVVRRTFIRARGTGEGSGTHTMLELVPRYSIVLGDAHNVKVPPPPVSKLKTQKKLTPIQMAIAQLAGGMDITQGH